MGKNYRTANGGTNPNLEDARQLFKLQGLLDDAMKQIETKNPSAAKAYNEATKFYKEDFIPTFRQGTVADVLQRGTRGEETRIAKANIAQAFDSLDGIDDFLRAVGNNQAARSAMKDYYSLSLSNSAIDSEGTVVAKKASTWLSKNISKLKKLGIENEFKTLEARQRVVDQTIANIDVFNKSIAGRILEADVENVISNAYRSSKNLPQTTRELLALAKGNKAAEQGLKKAFAEFLTKESESNAPGFFQAIGGTSDADIKFLESMSKMNFLFKKFRSSIRIMYIDEPVKLQAIDDMWTAFRILERTAKSSIGAGSPTAELIFGSSAISRGAGIAIGSVRPGFFYPFKVVNSWISNYGLHNTEAFLTKAMFDPDYAAIMTKAASPNGLTKEGVSTLNRLMRNVLLSSTDFPNRISSTEKEKKR